MCACVCSHLLHTAHQTQSYEQNGDIFAGPHRLRIKSRLGS